jgi:drug/metabolite transporter (DMT)-like permease
MSRPASTSDGHRIDLASVGAGACLLGLTPILYELSSTSPATGAFFRCLYAIPFLALLAAAQRGSTPSTRSAGSWVFKAVVAGVFFAGDLLLWHQAINGIGAGLATVLNSLQVVFAAVLGLVVLRQRISRQL